MSGGDDSFVVLNTTVKRNVCVKIEDSLLEEIDKFWREHGYRSRSSFIREAILFYMQYVEHSSRSKQENREEVVNSAELD